MQCTLCTAEYHERDHEMHLRERHGLAMIDGRAVCVDPRTGAHVPSDPNREPLIGRANALQGLRMLTNWASAHLNNPPEFGGTPLTLTQRQSSYDYIQWWGDDIRVAIDKAFPPHDPGT